MLRTLLANTSSNVVQFLVYAILVFVMTPIYVRELGEYDYGVWQILASMLGYFGILDLGLQATISRYAARFVGLGDRPALTRLFSTSLIMLSVIAILPVLILVVLAFASAEAFAPGPNSTEKYRLVLLLLSGSVFVMLVSFSVSSFLEGLQRYVIKNNIVMGHSIALAFAFVWLNDHFDPLILLSVLSFGLGVSRLLMLTFVLFWNSKHRLRFAFRDADKDLAIEMGKFGGKSFAQGASATAESQTDVLIIGALMGPQFVVFYSIPDALARYIQNLGWAISHSFMPAFSHLDARTEQPVVQSLFLNASRVAVTGLWPIAAGVIILGDEFISLWIGEEYIEGNEILIVAMTMYYFTPMLNPFSTRYLTAVGKHGLLAKIYPVRLVSNWALSILLMFEFGLLGVALGSLLPQLIVTPIVAHYVSRALDIRVIDYMKAVFLPLIIPTISLTLAITILQRYFGIEGFLALLAVAGCGMLAYLASYAVFALSKGERRLLVARCRSMLIG